MSKTLSDADVNRIRQRRMKHAKYPHPGSTRALAEEYGVSKDYIQDLCNSNRWWVRPRGNGI